MCLRDHICICLQYLTTSWLNWCVRVCLCEMCSCHHSPTAWLMSRVCVDSVWESVECHTLFPKPLVHCWVPNWLKIPALHCVYTHKTPRDGVTSSIIFSYTSGLQQGECLLHKGDCWSYRRLDCNTQSASCTSTLCIDAPFCPSDIQTDGIWLLKAAGFTLNPTLFHYVIIMVWMIRPNLLP